MWKKSEAEVFDDVAFRVRYLDETADKLHGTCVLNLANVKYEKDWTQIRGKKIATVFQDPMTSLNPDHNDRKTDKLSNHEASECYRVRGQKTCH